MRGLSSEDRGTPNHRVLTLREDFAFITPSKGPDGRHGTIDQDICDGIGQLHALGLLDGHGHDPQDLRDAGRSWRDGYLLLMKGSACKTSRFERADKSHAEPPYTRADEWWDRMDAALTGYERSVLEDLLIDPMIGVYSDGDETPWARSIIAESLLKRGRIVPSMRFPDANDWGRLAAAVRGLIILASAGRNRIAA